MCSIAYKIGQCRYKVLTNNNQFLKKFPKDFKFAKSSHTVFRDRYHTFAVSPFVHRKIDYLVKKCIFETYSQSIVIPRYAILQSVRLYVES